MRKGMHIEVASLRILFSVNEATSSHLEVGMLGYKELLQLRS